MRYNIILNILGTISKHIGLMFIFPIVAAILLKEYREITPFLITGILAYAIGFTLSLNKTEQKNIDNIKKTESLTTVLFSWILFVLICSVPYLFYGLNFTNSVFEATSGVTTTGVTVFVDFSLYPKTLFFFRSLTQWFGGMGIIVLFIAVLPKISVAGRQMFYAEIPAPTEDKATPRIRFTAGWLWGIYLSLTILEIIFLKLCNLDLYSAVVTSLSTMATGGFHYLTDSIAGLHDTKVTVCIAIFMFIAGINYILIYRSIKSKKISSILKSEEFKVYLIITVIIAVVLATSLFMNSNYTLKNAFLHSFFNVISTITTTGFASEDYIKWDYISKTILFVAFFLGGCATSTSGGMKIIRWIFIGKYLKRELKKIIHPKAVYPIKLEGNPIASDIISQMIAFVTFYFVFFAIGAFLIVLIENNAIIALSSSASAIGNVGLGFGITGPMGSFFNLHVSTKWILILLMLIGRLEIVPFLAILNKDLWKD